VLSPGNLTKQCKFRYVISQWGILYGRHSDQKTKLAFSMTALSFDTTSPVNPDEYPHKTYIARKHKPWATSLPQTVYKHLHLFLQQSCLKTGASVLNDSTKKTVFLQYLTQNGYSRPFKVICFDVNEKPLGDYILRHNFGLIYELW